MPKDSPEVVIQRMIDQGAAPEVIQAVAKEMANQQKSGNAVSAYVPRQITPVTAEQFIPAGDRNIFNQDISTSLKEGAGGVYEGASNLVRGLTSVVTDPIKHGYEAGNPFVTLGDLLGAPKKFVQSGTQGAKDLLEKSKNAKSTSEKLAYAALAPIPWIGPAVASIGEQFGSGNAEQMGEATLNTLAALEASPSFRALTAAGKAEAIAALKQGASKLALPPVVINAAKSVTKSPWTKGAIVGGLSMAKTGDPLGAILEGMGTATVASAKDFGSGLLATRNAERLSREKLSADAIAATERGLERRIGASKELQAERIGSRREDVASSNLRQDTNRATTRQQTLDDRVYNEVSQRDKLIEKQAQAHAVLAEGREHTETLLQRKLARDAEKAAIERQFKEADTLSRDGKTAQIRADALAERQAAAERRTALQEKHRAEDRAFAVSDTAERYSRQDAKAAEFKAAQKAEVHEKNIKAAAAATTAKELKDAKDLSDYYIQLAKNLDVNQKYALTQELEKAVAATQARLTQGLEAEAPMMTQRSTSMKDGTKTTVSQRFTQPPADVAEPVPGQPAQPAPAPSTTPRQPAARADAPVATATEEPDIFQQLRDQAKAEQPSWESNELMDLKSEAQQLSRKLVLTDADVKRLKILTERLGLTASELGLFNAAAGSEVNMGINPKTGTRAYDANRVAGRKK